MEVGVAGMEFTVTNKVDVELLPHVLFAVTEMLPLVLSLVAVIEFVMDVPLQPEGNVHV
jgi:hypothetical protein